MSMDYPVCCRATQGTKKITSTVSQCHFTNVSTDLSGMGKVFCEAEHGGDSGHGQVGRHDTDRANRLICDESRSRGYFTPNVADAESSLLNKSHT
jgi:hypothetical protein